MLPTNKGKYFLTLQSKVPAGRLLFNRFIFEINTHEGHDACKLANNTFRR
jgi:hypothetical protein